MGERATLAPPPAPARDTRWRAPLLALAAAVVALLVLAVLPRPLDGDEADALLLAYSLVGDHDAVAGGADAARRAELGLDAAARATLAAPGKPFAAPLLYGILQSPWVSLGGAPLGRAFQVLLLGLAAAAAALALARRAGAAAAWLPLLYLGATVTFVYAIRLWPEALLLALVVFAFVLAEGKAPRRLVELPDLYPEERVERSTASLVRWGGVGALLGAVASAAPWALPLLWPAAARVPHARRRAGIATLLAAAAVVGGGLWLATLLARDDGGLAAAAATAGEQVAALLSPPALRTLGWDLVHALAGRHLGLLLYCGPLLLLAGVTTGGRAGLQLWAAAGISLVLLLLLRPYDLAGSPLTVGLRSFLPVLGALWLAPARPPGRVTVVVACAWAAALLWPLWRAPQRPLGAAGEPLYVAPYLAPWVPLETTQPRLPFGTRLPFGDGRLVLLGGEAVGRGRVATVPTDRWLELLVADPGSLTGLWVEAGEQAGTELPVRGGEVTELMFRPDGTISFVLRPDRPLARHPLPGSDRVWSFYHLSLRFPGPAGARFTIRLRPA